VKDARTPTVTPLNRQISEVLNQVAQHPELVLSRRELIRYVLSDPGKRSEEVQALLRLSELDDLRTTFQKIANAAERDALSAKKARDQALEDLLPALGITKSNVQELLFAVNARRSVLGLAPLERLENTTSIRDGLDSSAESAATSGRIAKTQATSDIDEARKALTALPTHDVTKALEETGVEIAAMAAEPAVENAANRETLLVSALELFDEVHCPICGTEWDPAGFRQIVADKRKQLQEAISRRRVVEALLVLVNERMETAVSALNTASNTGLCSLRRFQ
jgi:DNA repair exonuclease SbcCD ATPase subunit